MDQLKLELELIKAVNKVLIANYAAFLATFSKIPVEHAIENLRKNTLILLRENLQVQQGSSDDRHVVEIVNATFDHLN